MGAAYRSSSTVNYGSRSNTTITAPAGVSSGDIVLLFFLMGAASPPTPTPPSGFTALSGFPVTNTSAGFTVRCYCWYKVATGSESSSYTITHSSSSAEAYCAAVSGGDTANAPEATTNSGTGTPTTALSITTDADGAFVMFVSQDWGDTANALSPPTGSTPTFTARLHESGGTGILFVADGVLATAGATGNKQITNNNSNPVPWSGYLMKVEAGSVPPPVTAVQRMALLGCGA